MLLHWCTLEPAGPSNLAAIRFSTPIRIQSIRIFPTDAQPFAQSPEVLARTEPEAFFLDVFFNAHPIQNASDGKQKQKAGNALVPSVIAYAGDQVDFTVDMGADCATRLMIVRGAFEAVSMAIYGDVVSELPPPPTTYEPKQISFPEPIPLARALDPCNASDPAWLAKSLLTLIPDSPQLSLIVRLMLCLKPSNDDWELPEFPFLYADLEAEDEEFDLDKAFASTSRPVPDDASDELLQKFADRIAAVIGPKSVDQSYLIAGILSRIASQHPEMAPILMQKLDLEQIFEAADLDDLTLLRLLDASTNASIARHLSAPWFLNMLNTIKTAPAADRETKAAARKLGVRIQQWQILEDALSNTQADFHAAAGFMKDIGTSEQTFGIWLECMTTHQDLVTKLAENPVLPIAHSRPPALLGNGSSVVSHDEFIAFVRAYIGVASVLAVYAWADSLPNDRCRERTLGVLRLWQGVDGYREIVNHLMLLRQMTFRLECMTTDNDPPTPSGVHAEHILLALAREPASMHSYDLIKCVLNLRQPLSVIMEDERVALRHAALVAEDGVAAAIEELTTENKLPISLNRIRTLRVALAVIERELTENEEGEWHILQALWKDGSHGLVPHIVDIFFSVNQDLQTHFTLTIPPRHAQELVKLLFLISDDLLRLIARLVPTYPLTSRLTRTLVAAVADVFVCTDAADMMYAQSSPASIAAQKARETCIHLVRGLEPLVHPESGKLGSEVVLRALLEHGLQNGHRDPAYHVLQVFCLIDQLLPMTCDASQSHWITTSIPNLLPELRSFFCTLDTENKLHFIKRLINLDQGVTGIGEWLLLEQLKQLFDVLHSLHDAMADDDFRLVRQYHASLLLRFVSELLDTSSSASEWSLTTIKAVPEAAQTLSRCFLLLLDGHMESAYQTQIATFFTSNSATVDSDLIFAAALILLRSIQCRDVSFAVFKATFQSALRLLKELPAESVDLDRLQREMSATFSAISESESALAGFDEESAEAILSALEWLPDRDLVNVTGLGTDPFVKLCTSMLSILSPGRTDDDLQAVRSKFQMSDDSAIETASQLPEHIELSVQTLERLLQPPVPVPSTPKRKSPSQDVLGLVTLSPPTALLRSPSTTGLTKTYFNNDFRQLRQQPSARQNTSRLPSTHVDVGILT